MFMTKQVNLMQNEQAHLVDAMCRMGEMLLDAGAETHRTEDTLHRIAGAAHAERADIFVITASIVITLTWADGTQVTSSRRISSDASTDFSRLEQLNELSREYCSQSFSAQEFEHRLDQIQEQKDHGYARLAGAVLAAASFAMFFKGTAWDALAAGMFAILIHYMQSLEAKRKTLNQVAFNLQTAFVIGFLITIVCRILPFLNADKIMIGDIMLLIPGIALTNAVRDILVGDTISGVMRLIETLIWSLALAAGFIAAIALGGRL